MVKLKDVTSEAIYLGKMSHSEAATLAKKLLKQGGIKISEQLEKCWIECKQLHTNGMQV